MLQVKQAKQHQVYFEKGDYEQKTAIYKRDGSARFNQQQLLLVAKGFFLDGQFAQCLRVLSIIDPLYSSKVLFERQSLQFRAEFLLKRHFIPNIEDMTAWREMLDIVQRQSTKVRGPPLRAHHFNVIKHYKDFLSLVEERLANKIVLDNDIFQEQKQLQSKAKRYEGFPIYLLAGIWVEDFNKAMSNKSETYLAPINNFSIVNDVFQSFHYQDACELYKNIWVFPGASFVTISKKYWNYLNSLINNGKQACPIKRLVSLQQSSLYDGKPKATRVQPLISVAIQCNQELLSIQLTNNKGVEEEFYNLVERKYGLGQFKVKSGDSWSIQDIQGPTQSWFQGFSKILYYHTVKMPKNIPLNRLRPLLKFQFQSLPAQYLKDPQNGLKGLENIGNSCYLNSCMQCLSKTQDIITFAVPNNTLQSISFDQKDGIVITAFSDLIKSVWNKQITKKSIYPRKFKRAFGQKYTQFLEKTQEDAHEFLLSLLNSLHEELKIVNSKLLRSLSKLQATTDQKRVKQYFERHQLEQNKSIIMNIFRGKIHNTMHCRSCQALSHSYDVFLALTLPIPQKQSSFLDIFFSGWETRQTKRYRIHLQNMKNAQQIIGVLKQAIKRKTQVEYYFIFGEINKENLTFEEIALISSESIDILQVTLTEDLIKKAEKAHFIIYEMKKKGQTELLALVDYRHEKNGLVLGFPKMMHVEERQMKQSLYMSQFKREIATNDKQNFFRSFDIEGLYVTRPKQAKGKPSSNIFDYFFQVIFRAKQNLFKGTDEIYEELNDPNTNYSIYDCFDLMRQPQILENSWTCGNCKKSERVQKRQEITQTSNILIIHLKRFKADYRKIKAMIEYPIKGLEIDKWIENEEEGERNFKYDLYAVCLHSGTAEYGHYKAYCKHFISQKWYQFDDGTVTQIQEAKVVSPYAYMLFYKRVNQM